jgi:hypothetical protein
MTDGDVRNLVLEGVEHRELFFRVFVCQAQGRGALSAWDCVPRRPDMTISICWYELRRARTSQLTCIDLHDVDKAKLDHAHSLSRTHEAPYRLLLRRQHCHC